MYRVKVCNVARISKGIKYGDPLYILTPSAIEKTPHVVRANESGAARDEILHRLSG
jgi:hypothetical protein